MKMCRSTITILAGCFLLLHVSMIYPCDTLQSIKCIEIRIFPNSDEQNTKPEINALKIKYGSLTTAAIYDKENETWVTKRPFPVQGKDITILDTTRYTFSLLNPGVFECRDDNGILYFEYEFTKKAAVCNIAINSIPSKKMVRSPLLNQEKPTDFKTSLTSSAKPAIFEVEAGKWGDKKIYFTIELKQSEDSLSIDINGIKEKVMLSDFTKSIPQKNRALILGTINLEKVTVRKECSE